MNGFPHTKLRRVPALILFFILGPAVLFTVLGMVIYRHCGGSRIGEEVKLTQLFRVRAALHDAEFVRPGIQTYFGLTLYAGRTDTPFLFCPEILTRPLDSDRLKPMQITQLFDESEIGESPLRAQIESTAAGSSGREWLIPDLYLKLSQWHAAEPFFYGQAGDFPQGGILYRIGRVHLIPSDTLFDQIVGEYIRPRRRFGTDILNELATIGVEKVENLHRETSSSAEVARYVENKTEMLLDEVLGLWLRAEFDSFTLVQFRLQGITATEPISLTLFQQRGTEDPAIQGSPVPPSEINRKSPLRWRLDCGASPFPTRVLSWFSPAMNDWGEECWVTGLFRSFPAPAESGGTHRRAILHNVIFRNARLDSLLKQVTSTPIEGNLSRLVVRDGEFSDGVFLGEGRIHLLNVQFKKDFLVRFQKEFGLEFQPTNTLVNRFPNDMIPLDKVMFDYAFRPDGVSIKASDPNGSGIAGVSESTKPSYRFHLPTSQEKTVPYPNLLGTLVDGNENGFWSPFYRDALNHLSVPAGR